MMQRLDAEMADFERCTGRIAALSAVHARLLRDVMSALSSDTLRAEVAAMQAGISGGPLQLGARKAFASLCNRLRGTLHGAAAQADEMRQMLDGSFVQLNTEYGFAFALAPAPRLQGFAEELDLIDENYSRYLSLGQAWRLAMPGFAEQFRRMLVAKLRVVFENAAADVELWSKTASSQIDTQLRERRRGYKRRQEALERIQAAAGDLEARIQEVETQDGHLAGLQGQIDRLAAQAAAVALGGLAAPLAAAAPVAFGFEARQRDAA